MASVIDSLFIELGLDTSKFDKSQKDAIEKLKEVEKTGKSVAATEKKNQSDKEAAAKKAAQEQEKQRKIEQASEKERIANLTKAKDAIIGFSLAALGANGFKDFVVSTISNNAALGRQAQILSTSGRDLDAWGKTVEMTGGTLQGFESSLNNIEGGLSRVKLGDTGILTVLGQLQAFDAVDVQKNTVDLYKLSDSLVNFKNKFGIQTTVSLAKQLGLDEATILTLLKGKDAVKDLHDKMYALSGVNDKAIEDSTKLANKWTELTQSSSKLGQTIMSDLTPALSSMLDATTKLVQGDLGSRLYDLLHPGDKTKKEQKSNALQILKEANPLAAPFLNLFSGSDSSSGSTGQHFSSESHGGAIGRSGGINLDVIRNIESGGNANAISPKGAKGPYQLMDPTAAQYGLKGNDVFNESKSRDAAKHLFDDLLKKYNGDIDKALAGYNWGTGNLDKYGLANAPEETKNYIAKYHQQLGAKMNSDAGAVSNSSQSSVAINSMTINTQATDANGTANAMRDALANNAFINAGTRGSS